MIERNLPNICALRHTVKIARVHVIVEHVAQHLSALIGARCGRRLRQTMNELVR